MRPVMRPVVFDPDRDNEDTTWFTFENLHKAYLACRKGKTNKLNHLKFFVNLEQELLKLETELKNRTYRPGSSIAFVVTKPKVREIFAAEFRDRVVHHLLCAYLEPKFERIFIHDSYACRKGKGTHRAVMRLQYFLWHQRRMARERPVYYLKMDVMSFFTSIDQKILFDLICKKVKRQEIRWLAKIIIFHDCVRDSMPIIQSRPELFAMLPRKKSLFFTPPGVGLPIGNLTSQFFANVYLNELDQFIKHKLKVKFYIRYVDDLVLLGNSKNELRMQMITVGKFAKECLHLRMHPGKQYIRPSSDGIDFLGYVVRADYILMRRRVVGNWRYKLDNQKMLRNFEQTYEIAQTESPSLKRAQNLFNSYHAHAKWGNCRTLVKKISKQYLLQR